MFYFQKKRSRPDTKQRFSFDQKYSVELRRTQSRICVQDFESQRLADLLPSCPRPQSCLSLQADSNITIVRLIPVKYFDQVLPELGL